MLPYAIVTYTVDGVPPKVDEIEPLPSEVPPQLQHIIERINAKADVHAGIAPARPSAENSVRPTSGYQSTAVTATVSVGDSSTGKTGSDVTAESSDANLQRVIAQINARLESQERSRQLALQNVAMMSAAAGLPPAATHSDVYPAAAASRVGARGDQVAAVLGQSAPRLDASSLGMTPVTAASGAGLSGYSGVAAAAQPKITAAAANMAAAAASGGYITLGSGARSAPFAIAPELVGASSALAGMQYPPSTPIVSASQYLRTLPTVVDAASIAAVDPATIVASQQLKYIPYPSQGRDVPVVGAASASGLYPLQSVVPADAVGAGYTLVNSGTAVKRPLNDVMLYMVDKRPRYY